MITYIEFWIYGRKFDNRGLKMKKEEVKTRYEVNPNLLLIGHYCLNHEV